MKKKFLLALMLITLSIVALGTISVSAATSGYYTYSVSGGKATITDCDTSISGEIVIPDTLGGYPVTRIDFMGFYGCDSLEKITLPNSITFIDSYAFCCDNLREITIPNSVKAINSHAFSDCTNLRVNINSAEAWCKIEFGSDGSSNPLHNNGSLYLNDRLVTKFVIPEGIKTINSNAFFGYCKLEEVIIPNSVYGIGSDAFWGCESLEEITIPNNINWIGNYAFYGCKNLKRVNISSIEAWCNIGFERYGWYANSNPLSNGADLYLNGELVTNLVLPDSVTGIGQLAFEGCLSLKKIIIPDGVKRIDDGAFYGCKNLEEITMPNDVTNIGENAFSGCYNLKTVCYNGNEEEWNEISIDYGNSVLTSAKLNCFFYVNLFSEDCEKGIHICPASSAFDFTIIPEKTEHSVKIYTEKTLSNEFDITTPINQNMDLYFVYKINQYTYKFIDESGVVIKEETVDYGTTIELPAYTPKANTQQYTYTFLGWDGYTDGMIVTDDVIFTPQYQETINQYTYKFLDEDGSVLKEETVDYGTIITPPTSPIKTEYYLFDYWQDYTEGITLTDDITFTAVYKYKDYAITAEGLSDAIVVTYNSDYVIDKQTKELYHFVGYFTEKDGAGIQITNEKGESLNIYNIVGDLKVYPYFYSNYMNKVELQSIETAMPGETITQRAIFATDKNATYFIATVKYPKYLNFKSIKGVDFKEATKDTEKVVGDYKYLDITCVYDYEGDFAEINTNYIPFEIEFEVSTDATLGKCEISIENVMLIGDDTFDITDIKNHTLTILPKLAENIEIIGSAEIDNATQFTAIVSPDYTTDKSVVWSINDETVATITQDGTVTPVKNGTVIITATAKDGSEVFATKTVNVIAYAKINSLDFGSGVVLTEFNPDVRKYTVYVKENATSISLTPTFSGGGVLRPNGSGVWVSGRSKDFELNDVETTITLNRENVTDMTDSLYTVTVVKINAQKTSVLEDGKTFVIRTDGLCAGNRVYLALYVHEKMVDMQTAIYDGEIMILTTESTYDKAKVLVWEDSNRLRPVCAPEIVK